MATYAKYADMYKNRTRSSDTKENMVSSMNVSPVRFQQMSFNQSQPGVSQSVAAPLSKLGQPQTQKLMTDRNTYMTFLEVQLERVSSACMNVQSFSERIEQLHSQTATQEEKIANISRLVKLLQSYSDAQEEDSNNVKNSLRNVNQRIDEVVEKVLGGDERILKEKRSPLKKQYNSIESSADRINYQSARRYQELEDRLVQLEDKFNSVDFRTQLQNFTSGRQTSLEPAKDQYHSFAKEVDRALKDMEERIYRIIEQKEYDSKSKMESTFGQIERKLNDLRRSSSQSSIMKERQKVVEVASSQMSSSSATKKIETALNDWLEKVEDQVNALDDKLQDRVTYFDLQQLEAKLQNEQKERQYACDQIVQIAHNAEKICTRLTDDTLNNVEEVRLKLVDQDDRFKDLQKYLEEKLMTQIDTLRMSQDTFRQLPPEIPQRGDVKGMEERISKKVADSIEQLGEIIKEYAKKQRKFSSRLSDVEVKLFGNSREEKKQQKHEKAANNKENSIINQSVQNAHQQKKRKKSPINSNTVASYSPPVKEQKKALKSKSKEKLHPIMEAKHKQHASLPYTDTTEENFQGTSLNKRNSFERILFNKTQEQTQQDSPRATFQKAREQSMQQLNESMSISQSQQQIDIQLKNHYDTNLSNDAQRLRESLEVKNTRSRSKSKSGQEKDTDSYMPLRNKGSKDYTMKDLQKLTNVLNSYRKSGKKNSNSEGKEKSHKRSRSKKHESSKDRSLSNISQKNRHSLQRNQSWKRPQSAKNNKAITNGQQFKFSPFGTRKSRENEMKARISRDREMKTQQIKKLTHQHSVSGIQIQNQKSAVKGNDRSISVKRKKKLEDESREENAAGKAKKKLKNLHNKKTNQRLAKLEKMYQELSEIEQKGKNYQT